MYRDKELMITELANYYQHGRGKLTDAIVNSKYGMCNRSFIDDKNQSFFDEYAFAWAEMLNPIRRVKADLDNAYKAGFEFSRGTNKLNEAVHFKLTDYVHGNQHIAEVVTIVMAILNRHGVGELKYYFMFVTAALFHDEAQAWGEPKDMHHETVFKYITNNVFNVDPLMRIVCAVLGIDFINTATLWEDLGLTQIDVDLVNDLIRTHRMGINEVNELLVPKYTQEVIGIKHELYSLITFADKATLLNPISMRNRRFDKPYNIKAHLKKIETRFLTEDASDINLYLMQAMLGNVDGNGIINMFENIFRFGDGIPDKDMYLYQARFIQDEDRSGKWFTQNQIRVNK